MNTVTICLVNHPKAQQLLSQKTLIKTIDQSFRGPRIKEKKSIFIGTVHHVDDIEEVREKLKEISKDLKKATHHAYAYRIVQTDGSVIADCHDDGEVHRTAGEPILNVMGQMEVVNALVIVTRYYGRIQLGPAGLTRMYAHTARDLLQNLTLIEM